jgi:hypothetical protein
MDKTIKFNPIAPIAINKSPDKITPIFCCKGDCILCKSPDKITPIFYCKGDCILCKTKPCLKL